MTDRIKRVQSQKFGGGGLGEFNLRRETTSEWVNILHGFRVTLTLLAGLVLPPSCTPIIRIFVLEIDCSRETDRHVSPKALQLTRVFWFQDLHTLDLEPFQHSGTNITGMRLVRPLDPEFKNTVSQWTKNLSPLEPDDKVVSPEKIQVGYRILTWGLY